MASQPDPNPVNLSLPWGNDLVLTSNGSLQFVSGVERVKQRIIRRFFTCPSETLDDGSFVLADYLFDLSYGIGAARLVGEKISNKLAGQLQQKIRAAVLVDEGVDTTQTPQVQLFAAPSGEVWEEVQVFLLDGTPTSFNFQVGKNNT